MIAAWLVCGTFLFIVLCWIALRVFSRQEAWLPNELKMARLRFVERDIFVDKPYALAGRPDRV